MTKTLHAIFDGQVLRPDEVVELEPNTRVRITIETIDEPGAATETRSFLQTALSLNLEAPFDSSALHQASDFWQSPSLEQLVEVQKTKPVADLAELAGEFWPEQESADDFIDFVYQQRREDSLKS